MLWFGLVIREADLRDVLPVAIWACLSTAATLGALTNVWDKRQVRPRTPTSQELLRLGDLFADGVKLRNDGAYFTTVGTLPKWIKEVGMWDQKVYRHVARFAPADAGLIRTLNLRAVPLPPTMGRITALNVFHDVELRAHHAKVDYIEGMLKAHGSVPMPPPTLRADVVIEEIEHRVNEPFLRWFQVRVRTTTAVVAKDASVKVRVDQEILDRGPEVWAWEGGRTTRTINQLGERIPIAAGVVADPVGGTALGVLAAEGDWIVTPNGMAPGRPIAFAPNGVHRFEVFVCWSEDGIDRIEPATFELRFGASTSDEPTFMRVAP